jgi:hypothetical protein
MELDNALIRQKDHILDLVRDEKYEEAIVLLNFSEDLWATCTYAYKTREIRERIRDALRAKQHVCAHWKQHEKWAKMLATV